MRPVLGTAGFAYLDERIHDLGDLKGELRPGYWPTGPLPVHRINLQTN